MPNPYSRFATPPFLTPEQGRMMAMNLPPYEEELPESPPLALPPRGNASRPLPPPMEIQGPPGGLPDPTMMTRRPERPKPDSYRQWQEAEEQVNSIQGQRPQMEKPGFWNQLAGGIAGGLGGYLASSPSEITRASADKAFQLAPELLRPGYSQKLQNWGADLQAAQDRAKRAKAGLDQDMDIEDSHAKQDYMEAQADYQRQLPGIAQARSEAGMVEITPESAKEMNIPDDMIGTKVPARVWTEWVRERSFGAKNKTDLEKALAQIEAMNARLQDTLDSREQEGARNRKSLESRAQTAAQSRTAVASIAANKSKGWKVAQQPKKDGDKYFAQLFNPDTKEYVDAVDRDGNRIEVAPPRSNSGGGYDVSALLPEGIEEKPEAPKPAAAKPAGAKPKPAPQSQAKGRLVTEDHIRAFIEKANKTRKTPITRAQAIEAAKAEGYDVSKLKQ